MTSQLVYNGYIRKAATCWNDRTLILPMTTPLLLSANCRTSFPVRDVAPIYRGLRRRQDSARVAASDFQNFLPANLSQQPHLMLRHPVDRFAVL